MTHSLIASDAHIAESVSIGRFCIVESGAILDENVVLGDYVIVQAGSRIGKGTALGTYTKVGQDVTIGSDCSFTAYCEIRDRCVIGNRVSMGSRCTIAADMVVENDVLIKYGFVMTDTPDLRKNGEKVASILKRGSRFGAGVVILPGVEVGENAEIGACSQVRHSIPASQVWYGNPARFYRIVS
jgi:UDP-2-acetamido-3-amino-2,3-dideoxy-glucuronate N-acetyltransferase